MVKAIIFDVFGVLITDGLSLIVGELRKTDSEKAERIVKLVLAASKGLIDAEASRKTVAAELGLTVEEYRHLIKSSEIKNQPLLTYIKELRRNYKTAILSNVISGGLEVRFSKEELADCFDVVISSGDVGYIKPEKEIYVMCAQKLGVDVGECVFVDDRSKHCEGAQAIGMQAIQYRDLEQLKDDLIKCLADSDNKFFG